MKTDMLIGPLQTKERLSQAARLWLFLDYDGTLATFAPTPDDILPDLELINILKKLKEQPDIRIAIVSGRRLAHVNKLVPIQGILIAGTYGIEIKTFSSNIKHRLNYQEIRQVLEVIKPEFEKLLRDRNGFYLEDKGWSLAIHARYAGETEAKEIIQSAYQLSKQISNLENFQLLGGNKFFEIAPKIADKGLTIEYLLNEYSFPSALPIFIGDDDKDEKAFGVINNIDGISILVSQKSRISEATLRLTSPDAVRAWLCSIIASKA